MTTHEAVRDTKQAGTNPKRPWILMIVLMGINALLAFGLGIARIGQIQTTSEEGRTPAIASTAVLVLVAAGVPWCFEYVARRLDPAAKLWKERWLLRIAYLPEVIRQRCAHRNMLKRKHLAECYRLEAGRIKSTFRLSYRLANKQHRTT